MNLIPAKICYESALFIHLYSLLVLVQIKNFLNYLILVIPTFFYYANHLNNIFENLSKCNEHSIANEDSCNGNEINFFHNVYDQYLSSKDANFLLFNSFSENSNFLVLCLIIT